MTHLQQLYYLRFIKCLTDPSALYTESGTENATFSLEGLTPSDDLPKGHFYFLNASFANSNGEVLKHEIYPIRIIRDTKAELSEVSGEK